MDGKAASGGRGTGTLRLGLGAGVRVRFSRHQQSFRTSEARGRVSLRRRQTRTAGSVCSFALTSPGGHSSTPRKER